MCYKWGVFLTENALFCVVFGAVHPFIHQPKIKYNLSTNYPIPNTMYPNPITLFRTSHQKRKTPILPTPTINALSAYTKNHQKPPIKIQREGTKLPALNYPRQTQKGTSAQNQGSHQTHVRVIHKLSALSTLSTNAAINARNAYPLGVY